MAQFDEKSLKKHIKTGEFLPIYLVYGNEDYLKKYCVDLLSSKSVSKDFESFNLEKFDGKNLDLQDVFESASIMPMMSDKRCLIIYDYKLENADEKTVSLITGYLQNAVDTSIIIFFQKSSDFSPANAKNIVSLIDKFGGVCVLNKRKGSELTKPLITAASRQGCVLSQQMANYIVSVVGDDFNVLINELNKVCNFAAGQEITKQHIDAVAIKSDEVKIYSLTNYLIQNNFDKAYSTLHTLLKHKVEPSYIFGIIVSCYVDMYRAKISVYCSEKSDALASDFNYGKSSFRLGNAAKDASRIDLPLLRKCLDVLGEADLKLKASSDDPQIVLEQLMVKLFLAANGERV